MPFIQLANLWTTAFLIASLVGGQTAVPPAADSMSQPTAPVPASFLVVPAGTSVPLTLITPIRSKSTKPGDAVRASVAFPITVDNHVAIPVGSYVEGTIVSLSARAHATGLATVKIRFDRLLFPSGYATSLDAIGSEALSSSPVIGPRQIGQLASLDPAPVFSGEGSPFGGQSQSPPSLPQLPSPGPSKAAITGAFAAGAGVLVVLTVVALHRHRNANYVLFDSGWQFRMDLQSPLTLDPARVKAAE